MAPRWRKPKKPQNVRHRSYTLRFAVIGFLACMLTPALAFIAFERVMRLSKNERLVGPLHAIPARIVENLPLSPADPRLARMVQNMLSDSATPDDVLWIVDHTGRVLSQSAPIPVELKPEMYAHRTKPTPFPLYELYRPDFLTLVIPLFGTGKYWMVRHTRYSGSGLSYVVIGIAVFAGVTSLLVAGTAGAFTLLLLRAEARQARSVLAELQSGNLEARFGITRIDEASSLKQSFNEMADEIERLVRKIEAGEQERTELLQFLAHDIRTPLTSLKLIAEDLGQGTLPAKKTRTKVHLLTQELTFFERMTEDLFFLAKIREGVPVSKPTALDFSGLVQREIENSSALATSLKKRIRVENLDSVLVVGQETLLQRLIRNALSNALKYAQKEVRVSLHWIAPESKALVQIADDGLGFPKEELQNFGKRKPSRYRAGAESSALVSLGLGSVILSQIAHVHGGTVRAENLPHPRHGACLEITLPARKAGKTTLTLAA